MTYVEGEFNSEWQKPGNTYVERLALRPASASVWHKKDKDIIKKMSAKLRKKRNLDPNEKFHYFAATWNSVSSIRRHYQKTFTELKLVEAI